MSGLGHVNPPRLGEYREFARASRDAAGMAYLLHRAGRDDLTGAAREIQAALKAHAQTMRVELGEK